MKKITILMLIVLSVITNKTFSQAASRLSARNYTVVPIPNIYNFMYIDTQTVNLEQYRPLFAPLSHLHLSISNTNSLQTMLDNRYTKSEVDGLFTSYIPTWSSISGKPSFATVATTGTYSDLLGKPTLFSGAYNDLTGKPTLFSGSYTDLTGKPTLFSGDYNDLSNRPSIPSSQISSDWNSISGVNQILNKPTLFSGVYSDLTGKPTLFSGSYTDLTNKPTISAQLTLTASGSASVSGTYPSLTVSSPVVEKYYNMGSLVSNSKEYTGTVNTNSLGIATFTITDTGISSGNAIFTNLYFSKAEVSDIAANYNYSYTLSGDKKTIQVSVSKVTAVILGLIQFSAAPINIPINISLKGN